MARLFFAICLIAICVIGLAFYFGYFHLGSESVDGTTHVTLTVEQKKLQEDEKKVLERVEGK